VRCRRRSATGIKVVLAASARLNPLQFGGGEATFLEVLIDVAAIDRYQLTVRIAAEHH
jgi:hypothetical protein